MPSTDGRQKTTYIYKLYDPRFPDVVRYVGKADNIIKRYKEHIATSKRGDRRHVYCWIRKVIEDGYAPIIEELEQVYFDSKEEWWARERYYISIFSGEHLTNLTAGGEGTDSFTPETRSRVSSGQVGRIFSEETRAKLREARKLRPPVSEEQKKKTSASLKGIPKGKMSESHLANLRAAAKDKIRNDKVQETKRNNRLLSIYIIAIALHVRRNL